MLQLVPVIEVLGTDGWPEWVPPIGAKRWIELGPESATEDVACTMAIIASYGKDLPASSKEAARRMAAGECHAAPGGLIARAEGFELAPGCCCGLEGWRDWFTVQPGGQSPWLGHDPSPYVECRAAEALLWPDEPDAPRRNPMTPLVVSYPDFDAALAAADARLTGFLDRLEEWAVFGDSWVPGLLDGFASSFQITRRS